MSSIVLLSSQEQQLPGEDDDLPQTVIIEKPDDIDNLQFLNMLINCINVSEEDVINLANRNELMESLLKSLMEDVGSIERKCILCRKIRLLYSILKDTSDIPQISSEALSVLLDAMFQQMAMSTGKEMSSIRNDLGIILLLLVEGKEELRKEFGEAANVIGDIVGENIVGGGSVEFPIATGALDIEFLQILLRILSLILGHQHFPAKLVKNCALVESGMSILIGPCAALDTLHGDEELTQAAWELLRSIAVVSPESFAMNEGLGAIFSFLKVFNQSGVANINFGILGILVDILRALLLNQINLDFVRMENNMEILLGTLNELTHKNWDPANDAIVSNILFCLSYFSNGSVQEHERFFDANGVKIILRLLNRLIFAQPHKRHINDTLHTCLAKCIWRCLQSSPSNMETFLGFEGMFRLLDFLEMVQGRSAQLKILDAIIDLTEYPRCLDQVLYWKRRNPPIHGVNEEPPSKISEELGTRVQDLDNTLGALLCELWRKEEKFLSVARTKEGLIEDLEKPLLSSLGAKHQHDGEGSLDDISVASLDLVISLRPKIHLIARRITEETNTEATLFGGLSPKNQVTMELIINMLDLKRGEIWNEINESLKGTPIVSSDKKLLQRFKRIAENKVLTVLDVQQYFLCRHRELQLLQERDLHQIIRKSEFQKHVLAAKEAEIRARTSDYSLLVDKRLWQKAQLAKSRMEYAYLEQNTRVHLTTNSSVNFTPWPGRNKKIESETPGFIEYDEELLEKCQDNKEMESSTKEKVEESKETEFDSYSSDSFQFFEKVKPPHATHAVLMRSASSISLNSGSAGSEEGYFMVNPLTLTRALNVLLNEEKKWTENKTEREVLRKWKSDWYH